MIGTVAGSYRILEKLGEGGMGAVYRAMDEMVERPVALKVLRTEIAQNAEVVERFRAEAVALARLNHPAIATLYSFFRQGDQYFMAMEFVPGETLEQKLAREGAMSWRQATGVLLRTLAGIHHAHQMGILHRDLKPANIMIMPDGQVKVTDFGIARILNSVKLTREARVVGTLEYLAPERALGRAADARSDLYSLGVVYYEMLTGRMPFQADTDFAMMRAQIEEPPPSPRESGVTLPPAIEAALMKSLAKNPDQRFADAAQFTDAIREGMREVGPPAREKRTWIAVGAALTMLAVAGGAVLLNRKPAAKAVPAPQSLDAFTRQPDAVAGLQPIAPAVTIPQPIAAPVTIAPEPASPPPARVTLARAPSADRILAALEATDDGAATVAGAGSRPLQWAGIDRALRLDRAAAPPVITQAVERRGVSFHPSADQLIDLRVAGASDVMLRAVVNNYRGTEPAAVAPAPASAPVAPTIPPPAKTHWATSLKELRRLYISPLDDNLDEALGQEIAKETRGQLGIAHTAEAGDAVMFIEVVDERGKPVVGAAGRVFGLKSKHRAIVRIVEPHSKKELWSAEAGDKSGVLGRPFGDSVKRMASRIAKRLRADWEQ